MRFSKRKLLPLKASKNFQKYAIVQGHICLRTQISRDAITWYASVLDVNVQYITTLEPNRR